MSKLWLVRQGRFGEDEQRALEENLIFMGWNIHLSPTDNHLSILQKLETAYPDSKQATLLNWKAQLNQFCNEMKNGDLIVTPLKTHPHIAIGRLESDNFIQLAFDNRQARKVTWLKTDLPRNAVHQDLLYSMGASQTICQISRNNAFIRIQKMAEIGKDIGPNGYTQNSISSDILEDDNSTDQNIDVATNAKDQIERHIEAHFTGHNFTRLIAEILKAQGYQTHISPPGADKGIDILAGSGALGFESPRLVIQVKSGKIVADQPTLQSLLGCIQDTQADQGVLVSWSDFTQNVRYRKNDLYFRVRLWGRNEIMDALFSAYDKLPEDIRITLPLRRIWTLVPEESN